MFGVESDLRERRTRRTSSGKELKSSVVIDGTRKCDRVMKNDNRGYVKRGVTNKSANALASSVSPEIDVRGVRKVKLGKRLWNLETAVSTKLSKSRMDDDRVVDFS